MTLIVPSRRGFLTGLAALLAAPAVVRADSLMPISARHLITRIGEIKPHVGAIPPGWIECNGRWLCAREYSQLGDAILGVPWAEPSVFYVPDLTERAALDRDAGKVVGRYIIYGGEQAINAQRDLKS